MRKNKYGFVIYETAEDLKDVEIVYAMEDDKTYYLTLPQQCNDDETIWAVNKQTGAVEMLNSMGTFLDILWDDRIDKTKRATSDNLRTIREIDPKSVKLDTIKRV